MTGGDVVVVAVEGPHDKSFLEALLTNTFRSIQKRPVFVAVGDCAYKSVEVFIRKMREQIGKELSHIGLRTTDVSQIIHVIDLDGVFVPDNRIIQSDSMPHIFYAEDGIHAVDVESIKKRNSLKRGCITELLTTSSIGRIAYRIYYMSHNIEHVFVDARNCSDQQKKALAKEKRAAWDFSVAEPLDILRRCDHGSQTWEESWSYVQTGMHSLERGTNLRFSLPYETGK